MGMALTGKVAPYKLSFGPMPGDVYHVPFPNGTQDITVADSLKALDLLFKVDIDPKRVAAIIIEPVQGEGGFNITPPELMTALRKVCDEHGILLIADEVQTGFGRTGKLYAMEHHSVQADLITMAKSLGGGMPISGVVGRADVMDAPAAGGTWAAPTPATRWPPPRTRCWTSSRKKNCASAPSSWATSCAPISKACAPRSRHRRRARPGLDGGAGTERPVHWQAGRRRRQARAGARNGTWPDPAELRRVRQRPALPVPLTIPDAQFARALDILSEALAA